MSKTNTGYSVRTLHGTTHGISVDARVDGVWPLGSVASTSTDSSLPNDFLEDSTDNQKDLMWVVPEDLAQHSIHDLPQIKGKELVRAIEGSVARELGGTPLEWNISWQTLAAITDVGREGKLRVYTLSTKTADLMEIQSAASNLPPAPGHALPSSMILDQFYRLTQSPASTKLWNIVFLSREDNFLVISSPECLVLTRALPNDLCNGSETEQYVDRLATEIQRSGFFIRQGAHNPEVDKIIVAGDPALASRLVTRLSGEGETPAHYWNMMDHFDLQGRAINPDLLISMAGAALALEDLPFNIMPRPKRVLFGPTFRRRALVAAGSMGAALLPILLVGSVVTAKVQEDYLKNALERLDMARFDAEKAAEIYKRQRLMLSRQNHLLAFRDLRPDLESVLLQMGAMAPKEVNFRDLRIKEIEDGTTRLTLTGESVAKTSVRAQEAFLQFQEALEKSSFLRSFGEPLKLEIGGSNLSGVNLRKTVFKMNFELVKNQDLKG